MAEYAGFSERQLPPLLPLTYGFLLKASCYLFFGMGLNIVFAYCPAGKGQAMLRMVLAIAKNLDLTAAGKEV